MTLGARQRELMKSWEEITEQYPLASAVASGSNITLSYDSHAKSLDTNLTVSRAYANSRIAFTTSPGYEYKVVCTLQVLSGVSEISFRESGGINYSGSNRYSTSGIFETTVYCRHDPSVASITFFCTFSVPELGHNRISNYHLYRRRL